MIALASHVLSSMCAGRSIGALLDQGKGRNACGVLGFDVGILFECEGRRLIHDRCTTQYA